MIIFYLFATTFNSTGAAGKELPMPMAQQMSGAQATDKKIFVLVGLKRTLGWVAGLARLRRNRNAMLEMLEFDDAQLSDIGLKRSDISAALHAKSGQDPFSELRRARIDTLRGLRRF